jgi:hypothetical protein
MAESQRPGPQRNAGAFLGPDVLIPVPMRTLDDESTTPRPPSIVSTRRSRNVVASLIVRLRGWFRRRLDGSTRGTSGS